MIDSTFWLNQRVLITGHTGFKGIWLSLLLKELGAMVFGYSNSKDYYLYENINSSIVFEAQEISDITNYQKFKKFADEVKPDVIFHLAAQPLVVESFSQPWKTFETNIAGTLNVVEYVRESESQELISIIITTDKVYKNDGLNRLKSFVEEDPLGGADPYSASKSAADILAQSYISSFNLKSRIKIARSGNVVGGGDRSPNRIMNDIVDSVLNQTPLVLRNPESTRPWLHVLDALNGYIKLAVSMNTSNHTAFNFAPREAESASVFDIATYVKSKYAPKLQISISENQQNSNEKKHLSLNPALAERELGWLPLYNLNQAIDATIEFELNVEDGEEQISVIQKQIQEYLSRI